jgi:hypothetical protein
MQLANTLTSEPSNSSPKKVQSNIIVCKGTEFKHFAIFNYPEAKWSEWSSKPTFDPSCSVIQGFTTNYTLLKYGYIKQIAAASSLEELQQTYPEYFI